MASFDVPQQLNGGQLLKELNDAGIAATFIQQHFDQLIIDIGDADTTRAKEIVAAHVGVDQTPTLEEKLASVGVTLDELKNALGIIQ